MAGSMQELAGTFIFKELRFTIWNRIWNIESFHLAKELKFRNYIKIIDRKP